jgi:hypothetical protein
MPDTLISSQQQESSPPGSSETVVEVTEGTETKTAGQHVFNEQTNYVPRSTIITVSYHHRQYDPEN